MGSFRLVQLHNFTVLLFFLVFQELVHNILHQIIIFGENYTLFLSLVTHVMVNSPNPMLYIHNLNLEEAFSTMTFDSVPQNVAVSKTADINYSQVLIDLESDSSVKTYQAIVIIRKALLGMLYVRPHCFQ